MKTTVNQRVKILREGLRMTQSEFSALIKANPATISYIENGEVEPRKKTMNSLIEATGVNGSWLLDGKGEMFLEGSIDQNIERLKTSNSSGTNANPWQDEAYQTLKEEKHYS